MSGIWNVTSFSLSVGGSIEVSEDKDEEIDVSSVRMARRSATATSERHHHRQRPVE